MGFDEAFRNQQFRFDRQSVDDEFSAGRERSEMRQHGGVGGIMYDDVFVLHDFRSEFADQFLPCGCPVKSGRHENRDLNIGRSFAQSLQNARHDRSAGDGTGVIAGDDDGGASAVRQLFQARRTDGIVKRPFDLRPLTGRRFRECGFENSDKIRFRHIR